MFRHAHAHTGTRGEHTCNSETSLTTRQSSMRAVPCSPRQLCHTHFMNTPRRAGEVGPLAWRRRLVTAGPQSCLLPMDVNPSCPGSQHSFRKCAMWVHSHIFPLGVCPPLAPTLLWVPLLLPGTQLQDHMGTLPCFPTSGAPSYPLHRQPKSYFLQLKLRRF